MFKAKGRQIGIRCFFKPVPPPPSIRSPAKKQIKSDPNEVVLIESDNDEPQQKPPPLADKVNTDEPKAPLIYASSSVPSTKINFDERPIPSTSSSNAIAIKQSVAPSSSSSMPIRLPSTAFTSRRSPKKPKKRRPTLPSPKPVRKPLSAEWREISNRLRSPGFKKAAVQRALAVFAKRTPKKRGWGSDRRRWNRSPTPNSSREHLEIDSEQLVRSTDAEIGRQSPCHQTETNAYGYPKTPPRYWEIDFPTLEEQRNQGLHVETDSPLFKSRKGSDSAAEKPDSLI